MADKKPIIRIPVDSSQFEKFYDMFKQYEQQLETMPEAWKKLNAMMTESARISEGAAAASGTAAAAGTKAAITTNEALAVGAASAALIVEAIENAAKSQGKLRDATGHTETALNRLRESGKGLADTLANSVTFAMKLTGVAGGLVGLGGIVGLADLSGYTMNTARNARGLNLSPGQLNSFATNMQPVMADAGGTLAGFANAQNSPQGWAQFAALGISPQQAQTTSANALAVLALKSASSAFKATGNTQAPAVTSYLALGGQLSDIRNQIALGPQADSYERKALDPTGMGFTDAATKAWTDLALQIQDAETQIKVSLIDGLAGAVPKLTDMTTQVTTFLTGFINSPQFYTDMKTFATDISLLATETVHALQFFHLIPGSPGANASDPGTAGGKPGSKTDLVGALMNGASEAVTGLGVVTGDATAQANFKRGLALLAGTVNSQYIPVNADSKILPGVLDLLNPFSKSGVPFDFTAVDKQFNLPSGAVMALAMAENNGHLRTDLTSLAGAQGLMQLMPSVQKQFGVNDPFDAGQSAFAGGADLAQLRQKYGGDIMKAVAAYNWGSANLDRDLKDNPDDWYSHAPKETQMELTKFLKYYVSQNQGSGFFTPPESPHEIISPSSLHDTTHPDHPVQQNKQIIHGINTLVKQGLSKTSHVTIRNQTSARVSISANAASFT